MSYAEVAMLGAEPAAEDGDGTDAADAAGGGTPPESGHHDQSPHERRIQIIEAILLAIITVVTAWAGFHGARWETVARLSLSHSTALQQSANDNYLVAVQDRATDAQAFQLWFTAYTGHDQAGADVAMRRFRASFKVAFGAWLATHPFTSPTAVPNPMSMPEYEQPFLTRAEWYDHQSAGFQHSGNQAGVYGDEYVRLTLMLAGVLFLVAISGQFKIPAARYALIGFGFAGLLGIVVMLTQVPLSH
jgi:hypothetical protein